jgi:hypothetical protein
VTPKKVKNKTVRLRLHVEVELLGTRVTPSPRKRDPLKAKSTRKHKLSLRQARLWASVSDNRTELGYFGPRMSAEEVADNVRLKADGITKAVVAQSGESSFYVEIIQKIQA